MGVLPPHIFSHAKEWPRFANPHLTGVGGQGPSTISNNENSKIGLKFSLFAVITLGRLTARLA